MKNRFSLVLLFLLVAAVGSAQTGSKFSLQGSAYVGLLEGKPGGDFQLGATGGVKKGTWTASIGTGIDYYQLRSVPLYLQVQKNLVSGTKAPFVYASGGYNLAWLRIIEKEWSYMGNGNAKGGLFADAGIGYELPVLKNSALQFSAGFSMKKMSVEEYPYDVIIAIYPMPPVSPAFTDYTFRRISMKVGLRF